MDNLAMQLDCWHFDDDLLVFKDGSLGAAFQLKGFDLTCATAEAINQLSQGLENLLVSATEGLRLQVFYRLTSDIEDLINQHQRLSCNINGSYQRLAEARVRFYRRNQAEGNYFVPQIFFFVRTSPFAPRRQGLCTRARDFQQLSRQELSTEPSSGGK